MTLRARKKLFYLLATLFVFLGGGAIFYSQGWRINFTEWKLQRTGAVFIQSTPRDASIVLDDTPIPNQSGLLQNGTLIGGLLPRTYTLKISKDAFSAWTKEAKVLPELVTKYEHVVLVPQKAPLPAPTSTIAFLPNSPVVFDLQKNAYLFTDSATKKTVNLSAMFRTLRSTQLHLMGTASLRDVLVAPFDSRLLILVAQKTETGAGELYALRINASLLTKIANVLPLTGAFVGRTFVWSNPLTHAIVSYDFSASTTLSTTSPLRIEKIEGSSSGDLIGLLASDGDFSVFNKTKGVLSLVATSTRNFEFSPDNQKVALGRTDGTILVYDFPKDEYVELSPRLSTAPSLLSWYKDSAHLFLISDDAIMFSEIEAGNPLNITRITSAPTLSASLRNALHLNPRTALAAPDTEKSVWYDSASDTLFFVRQDQLFMFSFASASQ